MNWKNVTTIITLMLINFIAAIMFNSPTMFVILFIVIVLFFAE